VEEDFASGRDLYPRKPPPAPPTGWFGGRRNPPGLRRIHPQGQEQPPKPEPILVATAQAADESERESPMDEARYYLREALAQLAWLEDGPLDEHYLEQREGAFVVVREAMHVLYEYAARFSPASASTN